MLLHHFTENCDSGRVSHIHVESFVDVGRQVLAFEITSSRDAGFYLTLTNFMIRPETFQSCTYRLPSLSQ